MFLQAVTRSFWIRPNLLFQRAPRENLAKTYVMLERITGSPPTPNPSDGSDIHNFRKEVGYYDVCLFEICECWTHPSVREAINK